MNPSSRLWRRSIAWPSDHGSWVFLISPLIIGLAVGGRWTATATYLVGAALCGFLIRQPMTVAVKAMSGRRSREDLLPALAWSAIYGFVGALLVTGLIYKGFGYVLYLAIPGVAVFTWYLYLIANRGERRQFGLEILAAGVLALTAPAGLWAGVGYPDPMGWLLWAVAWAQSAASIIYVYQRLRQRSLAEIPRLHPRLQMGLAALTVTSLNLLAVGALGADGIVHPKLMVAFVPQWLEAIWGTWAPAVGQRPNRIGVRQLIVSTIFTFLFVWGW